MLSSPEGSITWVILLQLRKDCSPISFKVLGRLTEIASVQLWNTQLPILVMPSSITIDVISFRRFFQGISCAPVSLIAPKPEIVKTPSSESSQVAVSPQVPLWAIP